MSINIQENPNIRTIIQEQPQLEYHLLSQIQKQEKIMQQKLQREQQKLRKIKKIEDDFVAWAEHKNKQYEMEGNKAGEKKQQYLSKIIKKCKERSRYHSKKQEQFKKQNKKSLNAAWMKAGQFNDSILDYYKSKQITKPSKAVQGSRSIFIESKQKQQDIKSENMLNNKSIAIMKESLSKYYQNMNQSNLFAQKKQQSIFNMTQYHQQSKADQQKYDQKLDKVLEKMLMKQKQCEDANIQQLGKKLEKIKQSRKRKEVLLKDRFKNCIREEADFDDRVKAIVQKKKKDVNRSNRVCSESNYKKQSKVKDYSLYVKQKQQQMFQKHLTEGEKYLHNLKVRHFKTVISKNVSYNAVQKKLFIERQR